MPRISAALRDGGSGIREGSSVIGSASSYVLSYHLGEREVWQGSPVAAAEHLGRALDLAIGSPVGLAGADEADRPSAEAAATAERIRWLLGVAQGAAGRYGTALTVLVPLLTRAHGGLHAPRRASGPEADDGDSAYPALAAATAASLHRQLGRHADARLHDEAGLACLEGAGVGPFRIEAVFDCTLGLAADAIGLGEPDRAAEELERAAALLGSDGHSLPWSRQRIRMAWVQTELALLAGRSEPAVEAGREAVRRAEGAHMPRHLAKGLLFLGVALLQTGSDRDEALQCLHGAAALAESLGATPLRWPALRVLAETLAATDPAAAAAARVAERAVITSIAKELPDDLRKHWITQHRENA